LPTTDSGPARKSLQIYLADGKKIANLLFVAFEKKLPADGSALQLVDL